MQSQDFFHLCRCFVKVDDTFLKRHFVFILLCAIGIDANGHNLLLAWAIVESENESFWRYFLYYLCIAVPKIAIESCVLIFDCDKGLTVADKVLGNQVQCTWCCKHFCINFTNIFGHSLAPMFWRVVYARTITSLKAAMVMLATVKPEAEIYCCNMVSIYLLILTIY